MQLIPKAGDIEHVQCPFDYRGQPYGLLAGKLLDDFIKPWADWFARRGNQWN